MSRLIKSEDLVRALRDYKFIEMDASAFECVCDIIESIPSAERKGRNLLTEYPSLFECSECGASCHDTIPWDCNINYCPNCGARMKGAEDEDR